MKFLLAFLLLTGCYQGISPKNAPPADLSCSPEGTDLIFAWCDKGHFHTTQDIGGGTVKVTGGNLIVPLYCDVAKTSTTP